MVVVEITLGVPIWFEDTMLAFLTSPNWPCVCWQQRKRYQPLTILTSDCQGFLKDKINFLFHPCEEQKNKLKQQKQREKRELGPFTRPRISCKFKSSDGMRSWSGILLKSKVGGSSVQEEVEPWLKVKRKHFFILLNFQQVLILLTILSSWWCFSPTFSICF